MKNLIKAILVGSVSLILGLGMGDGERSIPNQAANFLSGDTLSFSLIPSAEAARKRRKGKRMGKRRGKQRSNWRCRSERPANCEIKKFKQENYRNDVPSLAPHICKALIANNCFLVQGYRSCETNASLPGSATKSLHLCGCAADLRPGHCKLDRGANLHGTGRHKHYVGCQCPW